MKGTTLLSFIAPCIDKHPEECPGWAASGQCKKNREYNNNNNNNNNNNFISIAVYTKALYRFTN